MASKKMKNSVAGAVCAVALGMAPLGASAQLNGLGGGLAIVGDLTSILDLGGGLLGGDLLGGGIPVVGGLVGGDLLGGGIPVVGGLLGGDLLGGGIPVVGDLLGGDLLGGGIPVVGSLLGGDLLAGGGIPFVGQVIPVGTDLLLGGGLLSSSDGSIPVVGALLSDGGLNGLPVLGDLGGNGDVLASIVGLTGIGVPDLVLGGPSIVQEVLALGLDIVDDIIGGGGFDLNGIPLIGSDLNVFLTAQGLQRGVEGILTDYTLPIGLPVVGRKPLQLLVPVGTTLLATYGLDLGNGALPELGLGDLSAVLLAPLDLLDGAGGLGGLTGVLSLASIGDLGSLLVLPI